MKTYTIDPVTHVQVRNNNGGLVWDGDQEGFGLDDGIRGAQLVCRMLNLGCTDVPTIDERAGAVGG